MKKYLVYSQFPCDNCNRNFKNYNTNSKLVKEYIGNNFPYIDYKKEKYIRYEVYYESLKIQCPYCKTYNQWKDGEFINYILSEKDISEFEKIIIKIYKFAFGEK